MPQEQKWWRADIRTFIMNLWFIILLAFGFFQSIILNILTTPPNEWGARLTQAFDENNSYFSATYSQLIGFAVLVLILVGGSIDWWFTRYSLDDLAIHRRSGFLFKKNRTIRLESVQSVDISRPLVARLLGLSELRFEVADGSSEALHIKYVSARKAEVLRRTAMASINLLRSEAAGRPVDVLPDSMQISAERMPDADQLHQPFEASYEAPYGVPAQNSTQQVAPQQGAQQLAPEQSAPHATRTPATRRIPPRRSHADAGRGRPLAAADFPHLECASDCLHHAGAPGVAGARRGPHGRCRGHCRNHGRREPVPHFHGDAARYVRAHGWLRGCPLDTF